jgi:hypothetical protein
MLHGPINEKVILSLSRNGEFFWFNACVYTLFVSQRETTAKKKSGDCER